MSHQSTSVVLAWCTALVLTAAVPSRAQELSLSEVLARASEYVTDFRRQLSGIVAEESYEQRARASATRTLQGFGFEEERRRSDPAPRGSPEEAEQRVERVASGAAAIPEETRIVARSVGRVGGDRGEEALGGRGRPFHVDVLAAASCSQVQRNAAQQRRLAAAAASEHDRNAGRCGLQGGEDASFDRWALRKHAVLGLLGGGRIGDRARP